ncbi:calcium-activated potassium channel slowpoke-like [Paramacrobiotus metropolitanus]|uniref:calcium-activated potassium channel slowpoke-like n=1 Tax=Paramacrobiotus metropolitanus TaxID=2943436 RepID=UPI0024459BF1|nr:calcium-activated potassium channel slowpoke-like [Paramacrobiotus metropolitanus]
MERGDAVICFQELEWALTAQNCLAPGCATLLSNLIRGMSGPVSDVKHASQDVQDYLHGCYMELHSGSFSPVFHGMTFFHAAEFCYSKLGVVLIGTFSSSRSAKKISGQTGFLLCNSSATIKEECLGLFLASSATDMHRVSWYCGLCHNELLDITQCKPCNCQC